MKCNMCTLELIQRAYRCALKFWPFNMGIRLAIFYHVLFPPQPSVFIPSRTEGPNIVSYSRIQGPAFGFSSRVCVCKFVPLIGNALPVSVAKNYIIAKIIFYFAS